MNLTLAVSREPHSLSLCQHLLFGEPQAEQPFQAGRALLCQRCILLTRRQASPPPEALLVASSMTE